MESENFTKLMLLSGKIIAKGVSADLLSQFERTAIKVHYEMKKKKKENTD